MLVCLASANAEPLISNSDQPIGGIPTVYSGQWVAAPFQTGADPSRLDSIALYEMTGLGTPAGSFSVSIWGGLAGHPGALLAGGTLSGPSAPLGQGLQTYSSATGIPLLPNTEYWVVASSDVADWSDAYNWAAADTAGFDTAYGWQFFDHYDLTSDQGATWMQAGGIDFGFGPQLLEIDGTIVPEPSVCALLAAGTAQLLVLKARRREPHRAADNQC